MFQAIFFRGRAYVRVCEEIKQSINQLARECPLGARWVLVDGMARPPYSL